MADLLRPPNEMVEQLGISHERSTLNSTLDHLFERYLQLLDQYQTLQQELARSLSSGYMSLAQANFSNSTRTRYGQDYYDGRMQARLHVFLDLPNPSFSISSSPTASSQDPTREGRGQEVPATSEGTDDRRPFDGEPDVLNEPDEPVKAPCDPISWFGILVPSALRASQGNFCDAVTETIPAMASVAKEMREVEIEVRRTRKKLKRAV